MVGESVRVFKTKEFARFARKQRLSDEALCAAVLRAESGLIDADLGAGLIKQRVPRPGQGRSAGYRTIIAYRKADRAVFIHGFAKSERENVDAADLARLEALGAIYLSAAFKALEAWCDAGELQEVTCDDEEEIREQDR